MTIEKTPYCEWTPVPVADPRKATDAQFIHGMSQIVDAEGPILASRLFALYARSADLGRVYGPVLARFNRALAKAKEDKVLVVEPEGLLDEDERIVRLPDQKPVIVRSRGSRSLHEVPATELAEVMIEIRVSHELISREELFRELLKEYELIRLTKATEERLDAVLKNWVA